MRSAHLVIVFRLALLVAITASASLLVDYINAGDPAFCGKESNCFAVRTADFTKSFANLTNGVVTLPHVGLVAYLVLLAGSLIASTRRAHAIIAAMAGGGALFAAFLLYVQKSQVGVFCQWCVVVDLTAFVVAILAVMVALKARDADNLEQMAVLRQPKLSVPWGLAGSVATALPFMWASYTAIPPVPAQIADRQVDGKVTIVGFTDFQCPYCRGLHPLLKELKEANKDKVIYHRIMAPLDIHPGAKPAALGYLCTPPDKQEAMAEVLYAVEDDKLNQLGIVVEAAKMDIDAKALVACMNDPKTVERLAQERKLFDDIGGQGLPLTYVGAREVPGMNKDRLRRAVNAELSGSSLELPLWLMLTLVAGAAAAAAWRTVKLTEPEPPAPKRKRKRKDAEDEDEEQDDDDDDDAEEDGDDDDDAEEDDDDEDEESSPRTS